MTVLVCVLFLVALEPITGTQSRSLTDIRYRFTSCAASGQHGPRINNCIELFEEIGSPIMRDDLFVDFSGGQNIFLGAQGFRIPRAGVYNVTIAGAAGGRGVCNTQFGLGVVHNFQVNFSPDYELLIIVGQKGVGPCDTNPGHFLCQRPPSNLNDAMNCSERWYNWTRSLPSNQQDVVYSNNGGAGGGGASMIWVRHIENETFLQLPLFVSAGGGGSPAILDYDGVKADIQTGIGLQFGRSQEVYNYHLNGRPIHIQRQELDTLSTHNGNRGLTPNEAHTAGAGGGFFDVFPTGDTDGHPLSEERSIAEGGNNCINLILAGISNPNIFLETVGGFGGGGGGCGGGGGGGGYTGGSVFSSSNDFPGGGGYSAASSTEELTFPQRGILLQNPYQNDNSGYVEIVPVDCGCSDECAVNEDVLTFECLCKNEDLTLAGNGFDCYRQTRVNVEQVWTTMLAGFTFKGFQLLNTSVLMFSVQLSLQLEVVDSQSVTQCVVVYIDNENNPILITNIVRTGGSLIVNQLSSLFIVDNTISLSDEAYSILEEPELVSGVLLISDGGECSISEMAIPMNISTRKGLSQYAVDFIQQQQFSANIISSIFQSTSTTTTPLTESVSNTNTSVIVGVLMLVVAIVVISLMIFAVLGCLIWFRKSKRKSNLGKAVHVVDDCTLVASLELNPIDSSEQNVHLHSCSVKSRHVHDLSPGMIISRTSLTLGKVIGDGQFGVVYQAQLQVHESLPIELVAVKTLKGFYDQKNVDDILKESKKMCYLNHPNVQTLIGVCIDGGPTPYIVMPFMMNGSLLNFLRKNKDTLLLKEGSEEYEVNPVAKRLTEMCLQITKGMEYLAKNNIIHRDLAARNCMIDDKHVIRVSDFGLSENTYSETYIRQEDHKNMLLPVKWVAPESFNFGIFSEKSDVWTFGVTCWEVFSAGKIPYPGINAQSLPHLIDSGHRMDKPDNAACTDAIYGVMTQCWHAEAEKRPTFSELVQTIESDLVSRADYLVLGNTDADTLTAVSSPAE